MYNQLRGIPTAVLLQQKADLTDAVQAMEKAKSNNVALLERHKRDLRTIADELRIRKERTR